MVDLKGTVQKMTAVWAATEDHTRVFLVMKGLMVLTVQMVFTRMVVVVMQMQMPILEVLVAVVEKYQVQIIMEDIGYVMILIIQEQEEEQQQEVPAGPTEIPEHLTVVVEVVVEHKGLEEVPVKETNLAVLVPMVLFAYGTTWIQQ